MPASVLIEPEFEPARSMSIEEWAAMDEDDPGELVDGRLVEDEEADYPHEIIVSLLLYIVGGWARVRGGLALPSGAKYAVSQLRGRKPDLSILLSRDRKLPRRGVNRRPPDIMIEVVSPAPQHRRRDHIEKLLEYAAFGVRWYW